MDAIHTHGESEISLQLKHLSFILKSELGLPVALAYQLCVASRTEYMYENRYYNSC